MYNFMKTKAGFTVVELLVVVVVLGVLVGIAVPMYQGVAKNARIKTCNVKQRAIATDVKDWCINNNYNDDFVFTIISDGEKGTLKDGNGGNLSNDLVILLKDEIFDGDIPYCPGNGTVNVTVEKNSNGPAKIKVSCNGGKDGDCHKK